MTDLTLHLNYWILGDNPTRNFTVRLPGHENIFQLKDHLIRKNEVELREVPADNLRIWCVDIEVGKLNQIKNEQDIEGTEVISSWSTPISEVFPASASSKLHPERIDMIVSHPSSGRSVLRSLYEAVWNKPGSLVSRKTVTYKMGDGESSEKSCDVFDLGEHAQMVLLLGFTVGPQLVVTEEYKNAFEFIESQFSQKKPLRGFVVTGQPGIGKSLFLLYVLLKRMQEALPVALQCPTGYYLVDDKGVWLYENSTIIPLLTHRKIWCLSDSRDATKVPTEAFLCSPPAQIIQAASPQKERWKSWTEEFHGGLYVMDTWNEGELALLGSLRGEGDESVSKMLQLSSEWGPSPRHLMGALDANVSNYWKNSMPRHINEASDELATDPLKVLTSITSLVHESIASSVLWMRPQVDNRADFDMYIPDATKIREAVHEAFKRRSADELTHYFNITYHNSHSRGLAGYLSESLEKMPMQTRSDEKGKGRAIEEDLETPGQSTTLPSTSSMPTKKRQRTSVKRSRDDEIPTRKSKRTSVKRSRNDEMPAQSTSSSDATAPAQKQRKT